VDPLARIEPVARPLLQTVDTALGSLGAPPEHPVWGLLREVGATPGDAVTFVSMTVAAQLRETAGRLRELGGKYREAASAPVVTWHGQAGDEYAAAVRALDAHLRDGLVEGIDDTAAYLTEVAQWQERARLELAGALGDVMLSAEAVTLAQARAGGLAQGGPASRATVLAAAEVAVHVLRTIVGVIVDGEALQRRWAEVAVERPMRAAPVVAPAPAATIIEVRH
jgi:uncharacterized protein YukE